MYRTVKNLILVSLLTAIAHAGVPQQINHQGVVKVNGQRFDGAGAFRFAIVDPDTGVNLWCNNDNAGTGNCKGLIGVVPQVPVSLTVANGVYTVGLGDTDLVNMTPIPSSVFNDDNAVLRIWFDDGVNGTQQLTPDHKLTTAPYSFRLPNIFAEGPNVGIGTTTPEVKLDVDGEIKGFGIVPIGSIIAWHKSFANTPGLPSGWLECNGQTVNDPESSYDGQALPNLNSASGYFGGRFLRGGNVSGTLQDATTLPHQNARSQTGALYIMGSDGTGPSISYLRQFSSFSDNLPGQTDRIRTVNMSVVWIMRVK